MEKNHKDQFIIFDVEAIEQKTNEIQQAGPLDTVKNAINFVIGKNHVNVEDVQNNINDFLLKVQNVLSNCPIVYKDFNMDMVEINAEISAEGQIGFMGTHVGVTGTGGIKFVFNRIK